MIPDACTLGLGRRGGRACRRSSPRSTAMAGDYCPVDSLRSGRPPAGCSSARALVLWIALLAEAALKKEAMGFGDVKFTGAIGAFCGWHGAVFAGLRRGRHRDGLARRSRSPGAGGKPARAPRARDRPRPARRHRPRRARALRPDAGDRRRPLLPLPPGPGRRWFDQLTAFSEGAAPSPVRGGAMHVGAAAELGLIGPGDRVAPRTKGSVVSAITAPPKPPPVRRAP